MSEPQEEWIIRVDNMNFKTDREGKDKVLNAMRGGKRFVPISKEDIISVRHISYIYLKSRQIKNQLEAPKEEVDQISDDKYRQLKKEVYTKIGKKFHTH